MAKGDAGDAARGKGTAGSRARKGTTRRAAPRAGARKLSETSAYEYFKSLGITPPDGPKPRRIPIDIRDTVESVIIKDAAGGNEDGDLMEKVDEATGSACSPYDTLRILYDLTFVLSKKTATRNWERTAREWRAEETAGQEARSGTGLPYRKILDARAGRGSY